jgi:hypothetical protein
VLRFLDPPKVKAIREIKTLYPKDTPILEIGFGRGEVLKELVKAGFQDILGTETSQEMIEKVGGELKGKVSLISINSTNATSVWYPKALTLCFEVIEHLQDPLPLLCSLPKGDLYLSTPNPNRWWVKLTSQYEDWDFPPNHVWRLLDGRRAGFLDLRTLLESAGYSKIEISPMPIRYDLLLQPLTSYMAFRLGWKVMSGNYDIVRGSSLPLPGIYKIIRRLSWPLTYPLATVLNTLGYVGQSWYVKAIKE